ncbi:MAG: murein biosynthesis integral membrane protein MurJ [Candidatus Promineofilum sp.]|nr:murein biosynthesis integral membrane protein MurJ [Promineifilum sp.]
MKLARAFSVVALLTLVSSFLGYVRDAIMAARFGASMVTDGFFAAFFVPNTLSLILLSNSVAIVFLPIFVEAFQKDKRNAWRVASILFNLSFWLLSAVVLLASITAKFWMPILYSGFPDSTMRLAITLTQILMPMLLFIGLSTIVTSVLNSFDHFYIPAFAPVLTNIIVIVAIVLSYYWWDIEGVAVAVTLSAIAQLLVQLPILRRFDGHYSFSLQFRDPLVARIFRLAIPLIIYFAIAYASQAVERNIASSLIVGTVSAMSYAANLFRVPIAIFAGSIGTVIFPRLSLEAANETNDQFSSSMSRAIGATTMFLLPLSCWLLINSEMIVNALFGFGRFSADDVHLTSIILAGYAIGMTANGITRILQRAFYAVQDTVTPVLVEVVSFVVYTALVILLVRTIGTLGLGIARSVYFILVALLSFWLLRRHPKATFEVRQYRLMFGRYFAASAGASLVWLGLAWYHGNYPIFAGRLAELVFLGISAAAGAIVFVIIAYVLKAEEVEVLAGQTRASAGKWKARHFPST